MDCKKADIAIGIEIKFPSEYRDELSITFGLILYTLHIYFFHFKNYSE